MTISDEDDILLEDFDDQEMMDIDLDVKPTPMAQKAQVAGLDLGAGPATASKVESSLDLDMLKDYYHRSFPSELMYQFLQSNFPYREFSFTLAGDIYVRFKSFNTLAEFKQDLVKARPIKIDIGGVYDTKPKEKRLTKSFNVLKKEFVLDIDLTDYDDIRTCCNAANICKKCWMFITTSIQIIDSSLKENFGFQNIVWVYSGRRGVHCWIADMEAVKMSSEERRAVVMWFSPPSNLKHPFVNDSFEKCKILFLSLLTEMDILTKTEELLKLVPATIREQLKKRLNGCNNSIEKWKCVKELCDANTCNSIILKHTWPRLDQNVSIGVNHLLKSPFCVHPKTGRVCVPFDITKDFDPFSVPTMDEINEDSSLMEPYLEVFRKFVNGLEHEKKINTMEF